jgi:hypothetical protein
MVLPLLVSRFPAKPLISLEMSRIRRVHGKKIILPLPGDSEGGSHHEQTCGPSLAGLEVRQEPEADRERDGELKQAPA